MRTAGLMMNDVWAHRVLRERGVDTHRLEGVETQLKVLVESLEIKHRSKDENYRPYLHIVGELRSVTPTEVLPYGISEVTYSPGQGEKVDAYYEFDDAQLVKLASRGYFSRSFDVPAAQVTGIEWELPAQADILVLAPSGIEVEGDVPVVFTQVHNLGSLDIDLPTSGYDLADYFADFSQQDRQADEPVVDERSLRARSDAINSLFSEEELEQPAGHEQTAAELSADEQVVADPISVQLSEVEAAIAAEAEQFRVERENQEGTPEKLYRDRVALRDDMELAEEQPAAGPTFEERKAEVSRRAADLDFGEDEGQDLGI
jgi:hypothetical protein